MARKLNTLFSAIVLTGIAATSVVFAQGAPTPQSSHKGMMSEQGGMQHMMKQMKPDQMKRMTGMTDKCNDMMDGAPTASDGKRTSANKC